MVIYISSQSNSSENSIIENNLRSPLPPYLEPDMNSDSPIFRLDQGSSPAFLQQGQIDWVAFGNTAWNLTSATLQRFSTAEIQPATYGAGLALGCRFNLGAIGRRRIGDSIRQIQGSPSFEKLLWFGFGYRSFVYLLSESQAGFNCLALCACLVDTHSYDIAATILSELWTVCEFPHEYQPSHAQFVNLVKACEGVLARTSFGPTVEKMTDLREFFSRTYAFDNRGMGRNLENCAKSKDIAKVLRALFDITRGKIETITVAGATECAFIGGVAQWLFDLNVYIEGTSDRPHDQTPQVIIRYDLPLGEASQHDPEHSVAKLRSATYYLENTDDYWSQISSGDKLDSRLILRVPWETCLSRSFGIYFDDLCSISLALGEFLGSAARIFSAFALGEEDLGTFEDYRHYFTDFLDACHGSGLVYAITTTFPELADVKDLAKLMRLACARSFTEAIKSFQASHLSISQHCGCIECAPISSDYISSKGSKKTCLRSIGYAILRITRFLGAVGQSSELLPTISGIRHFCTIAPRKKEDTYYKRYGEHYSLLHTLLDLGNVDPKQLLCDPITLFSGSPPKEDSGPTGIPGSSSMMAAISWRGFCSYQSILKNLTGQPEHVRIVYILPGHIEYGNRSYNAVYDHPDDGDVANQRDRVHDFNISDRSTHPDQARSMIRAIVTEQPGAKALYFAYTILLNPGRSYAKGPLPALYILPGSTTYNALRLSCLIPCGGGFNCRSEAPLDCQYCQQKRLPLENSDTGELSDPGTGPLTFKAGVACTASRPEEDDIDTCIALRLHQLSSSSFQAGHLLIRRHECLPCSVRAAVNYSAEAMKHIQLRRPDYQVKTVFHIINTQGSGRMALSAP